MNFFMDNESDLEEEQLNITTNGQSEKTSQKTKNYNVLWVVDEAELGNNFLNLNKENSVITKNKKERNLKKNKNKEKPTATTSVKQTLLDRLKMYNTAEENARKAGETKRVRLLNRKIQILNALIGHHDSGNIIDPDNIPPEIKIFNYDSKSANPQFAVTFKESAEITLIPRITDLESTSSSDTDSEASLEKVLGTLRLRRDQYKISVAQNKSTGNVPRALEQLNIVKMFDSVIRHLEMGEKVDLNELPGPPECPICHLNIENKNSRHNENHNIPETISESSIEEQIISHSTVLQALQERLRSYEISKMNAKKENNVGQALRIDRIIKIYKEAIKLHRAGKSFPIDELPSPPGFAPLENLKTIKKFNSHV